MTTKLPDWNALQPGDALPALQLPPITRHTLALYCGASGDHNPIHVDIDFAKAAGMPDVFAHGMLSAAWLARVLTNWVPQRDPLTGHALRRHHACGRAHHLHRQGGGEIEQDGRRCAKLQLATANQDGITKLTGEALVAWN